MSVLTIPILASRNLNIENCVDVAVSTAAMFLSGAQCSGNEQVNKNNIRADQQQGKRKSKKGKLSQKVKRNVQCVMFGTYYHN